MKWLKRLVGGKGEATGDATDSLQLQRDMQSLRLELRERESRIDKLEQELQQARHSASERVDEVVESRIERFLAVAAGPASQLLTQAHLLQHENRPVEARDVLAVAQRLVKNLEELDMRLEGEVGEIVRFDPDRHTPLGNAPLERGDEVAVRFVAVKYGDKIIRKAGVQKAEAE
jgi:hypothetical protein